ncbi:MAG: periplasmic heavy metal sensor [Myxococcota bacterium]|jgi:uncharacterized membrane protein|nr:periplasmic heavy metal sensor [Myxococcota bacterium]
MSWNNRFLVLLAISIGLNLVLAGVLLGSRFARGHGHPPEPPHSGMHAGRGFDRALLPHRAELGERRRASAQARSEVQSILNREPLDRAALDAALAKLRAETQQSQEILHRALSEAAVKAPPEQRRALGKWLSGGRSRFRDRRPDPSAD